MCDQARCAMCGKVKLGLPMAWMEDDGEATSKHSGHVCYGCEDLICLQIGAGRTTVRWLETIGECK